MSERFDMEGEELRALGARAWELVVASLEAERRDPITPGITGAEARALVEEALPREGGDLEEILAACARVVMPGSRRNGHPGFFGYVSSSVDPVGVAADAIASALNQNLPAWRSAPVAVQMERTVVGWLSEAVGFGSPNGYLTSGGSMANFSALATALRNAEMQAGCGRERVCVYLTSQTHFSLKKAAMVLGVGEDRVRLVAVDERYRMVAGELVRMIERDRAAGLAPACVCLSAGTTNTGAIDPIEEIVEAVGTGGDAGGEAVWVHVDGAYGAPAAMLPAYAVLRDAFARVDSLSLDPHKWLFAPLDCGCLLVRDDARMVEAMSVHADYTAVSNTEDDERYAYFDRALETSRRFRALKVWMILKARGVDAIAERIAENIELREYLDERIAQEARLEGLGSGLSVSCFRYVPGGAREGAESQRLDEGSLESLNRRILEAVVARGDLFMSPTVLGGWFTLRACIVNFRTRAADIDRLVEAVVKAGDELS